MFITYATLYKTIFLNILSQNILNNCNKHDLFYTVP